MSAVMDGLGNVDILLGNEVAGMGAGEGMGAGAPRNVLRPFLGQDLAFALDPTAAAHLALAAVPLGTRSGVHRVRVTTRSRAGVREITRRVRIRPVRYPLTEVRIRPQPGAVRPGELAVDGRARIREVLRRVTPRRHWRLPFHRPLATRVTEAFGVWRRYLRLRDGKVVRRWRGRHLGLDLDGEGGEPVGALTDGVVVLTGHFLGPGKCVFLDHGQGFLSAYFHLREVEVKEGASVRRGEILGRVGATGNVSGPHLHLLTRLNGQWVDPAALLELGH